jgi:flagellar biosynthesis/type III secretory pathway M-ring protein FliF/YscJ
VSTPFDGTVTIGSTTPPVQANYTTIRNWAERILQEVEENNRTAHQNYGNIVTYFGQVGSGFCVFMIVVMVMIEVMKMVMV